MLDDTVTTDVEANNNALVVYSEKGKQTKSDEDLDNSETAVAVLDTKVKAIKSNDPSSMALKRSASTKSLTSVMYSLESEASPQASPAFSSSYFTGSAGFLALPLVIDEMNNVSFTETVKHSNVNSLAASRRRSSRSRSKSRCKHRVAELSA
jgi:hypothetical protein